MKNIFLSAACAMCTLSGLADPGVEGVTFSQDAASLQATIRYTLTGEEPAIVTLDVLTNGVSIGAANIRALAGDVNRLVQPGDRTILWRPDKSWGGHLFTHGEVTSGRTALDQETLNATTPIWMLSGKQSTNCTTISPSWKHSWTVPEEPGKRWQ